MAALLSRSLPAHRFMLFALLLASTGAVIHPTIDFVLNEAANAFEVLNLDPATGLPGPGPKSPVPGTSFGRALIKGDDGL